MSTVPLAQVFVGCVAVAAWAYMAYSMLRAWRHRRPGTYSLATYNLTETGRRYVSRGHLGGALFVVCVVALIVLKKTQGK